MDKLDKTTGNILDLFAAFKTERWLFIPLLVITLIGSAFGYYYYEYQFSVTPPHLWLFVPDCPLFTTFFAIVLIGQLMGKESPLFNAFTFAGLLKYGIWTVFVLLVYWNDYFSNGEGLFRGVLMIAHIGMILLALTMVNGLRRDGQMDRISKGEMYLVGSVFLIFDFFDYVVGAYPLIPTTHLGLVSWFSVGETFAVTALLLVLSLKKG
ncbi:MAG: DUF1405 domain-containing protein [Methanosarcinales archaeon]|nr:DUF1405 domain-containing protein [Methanosarcinales archaeon]